MWRWLSVVPMVLLMTVSSFGASTSTGPTSDEEARVLWKEGQSAFQENRYKDAIYYLQRLVNRYPAQPGSLKAQLYLGESHLALDQPKEAIGPLQFFIAAQGANLDSARARISLGKAFLKTQKFFEAQLTSQELEKISQQVELPSDVYLETLLLQAEANLGLRHEARAQRALELAKKKIVEETSPEIRGHSSELELKLKTLSCSRWPSPGALDESQLRDQLNRRGTCLMEALLSFQKILKIGEPQSAQAASMEIRQAFKKYYDSCANPPPPAASGKRSAKQLQRYRKELADLLTQECRKNTTRAIELLESWKKGISTSMIETLGTVTKGLQPYSSRNS